MLRWMSVLIVVAIAQVGCASAEPLQRDASGRDGAIAEHGGVSVTTWAWAPEPHKPAAPLAVEVRIDNGSGRSLRVDYDRIWLAQPNEETSATGRGSAGDLVYRPMEPPIPQSVRRAIPPRESLAGVWPGPFADSTPYQLEPRTPDAPQESDRVPLREQLLPDGETTDGFVFFADYPAILTRMDLVLEVEDADTNTVIGRVRVPLYLGDI